VRKVVMQVGRWWRREGEKGKVRWWKVEKSGGQRVLEDE